MNAARARWWAAGALVAGVLLRVPMLASGCWRDEASSYFDVAGRSLAGALQEIARAELNPPGYFLVLGAWLHVAGGAPLALKLPSFVFGLGAVAATYLLARACGARAGAVLATLFAATNLGAIEYSAIARPYALATLLATLVLAAAVSAARTGAPRTLVALGVLAAALMDVQYTGIAIVAAIAATAFVQLAAPERRRGGLGVIAACACAALVYAPQWPAAFSAAATPVPWISAPQPGATLGRAVEQLSYAFPFSVARTAFVYEAIVALVAASVLGRARLLRSALPYVVVPVLVTALAETRANVPEARYMVPLVPAASVALGIGCVRLFAAVSRAVGARRFDAASIAAAVLASAVLATIAGAVPAQAARVRDAYAHVELSGVTALVRDQPALSESRTLVVVAPDYLGPTVAYDTRDRTPRLIGFPHRDAPQYFRPRAYDAAWTRSALERAMTDIERSFRPPFDRLAFIGEAGGDAGGALRLELARELGERLRARYRVLADATFAGRLESVRYVLLAR